MKITDSSIHAELAAHSEARDSDVKVRISFEEGVSRLN